MLWTALTLDTENKRLVPNVEKERLKFAPGLDQDKWPDMADQARATNLHSYCGIKPYPPGALR